MSGLKKHGVDANPFGSKFKDVSGGFDAGNGKRTYTKPSYTLFVTKIPDAESSDSVAQVFENDAGFMQCRPVGHKARRMAFIDYDSIERATKGMQVHQGHKWDEVDEGLNIDYDKDARSKRNTALDAGLFEKFWPIGARKPKAESDRELFARLKAESSMGSKRASDAVAPKAKPQAKAKAVVGARLQIKGKASQADEVPADGSHGVQEQITTPGSSLGGLVSYGSDSEDDEDDESACKRAKAA